MLTLGIQPAADREHAGGKVHRDHVKAAFEMRGIVAPATADLEERVRMPLARFDKHLLVERCFFDIVFWRRKQGPPGGKLRVHLRFLGTGEELVKRGWVSTWSVHTATPDLEEDYLPAKLEKLLAMQ
jgi:hypothetical protein